MPLYSTPTNSGDSGHGFSWKSVFVQSVNLDTYVRTATCIDQFGKQMSVRCDIMQAKGVLPVAGEQWIVERKYGQWIFAAIINGTTRGVEVNTVTGLNTALQSQTTATNAVQTDVDNKYVRRPTGDIELTIRTTAKPNSLLMQGQTISRTTYADLWNFASGQNLVGTVFGAGDGSSTFVLPDCRGRVPRGVAASGDTIGSLLGADSLSLAVGQLPSHNHGLTSAGTANDDHHHEHTAPHTHDFNTNNAGSHSPHPRFPITVAAGSGATYVWAGADQSNPQGDHYHGGTTGTDGVYSHTDYTHSHNLSGSTDNTGSGSAVDLRQASFGVNWLIWT